MGLHESYDEFVKGFVKDIAETVEKNIRELGADREDVLKWAEEVCERHGV